jgi:hypothetical protein
MAMNVLSKLSLLVVIYGMIILCSSVNTFAQEPDTRDAVDPLPTDLPEDNVPAKEDMEIVEEPVDASQGEKLRKAIVVKPNRWVYQRSIEYTNGDITMQEFRPQANSGHTLYSEVKLSDTGRLIVTTWYRLDGNTVLATLSVNRRSGKSVMNATYTADDGTKLSRNWSTANDIIWVTVSDSNNNKLYLQKWIPSDQAGVGLVLATVVEYENNVATRRLFIDSGGLDHVEILNPDGSVKATEQSDKLSKPVDPVRLGELNESEDPTAIKTKTEPTPALPPYNID